MRYYRIARKFTVASRIIYPAYPVEVNIHSFVERYEQENFQTFHNYLFYKSFNAFQCLQIFIEKIQNPVLMSLKNCRSLLPENCVYKGSGCNLKFPSTYEVAVHIKQCQFRPCKCIGQTLNVWICSWIGLQDDLPSHFLSSHPALGNALPYLAHSFIPFKSDVTYSTLNLVDACRRKFVFYYNSNSSTQMVYFIIFLIGSKDEASQYVYEFEIKSPAEKYRKVIISYN